MKSLGIYVLAALFFVSQVQGSTLSQTEVQSKISQDPHWKLLKSLGWKLAVEEEAKEITLKTQNPLTLARSSTPLDQKGECKIACISVPKNSSNTLTQVAKLLLEETLPQAVKAETSQRAYRLKLATLAETATQTIGEHFSWPDDGVDALGTGFSKYYDRQELTLEELIKSGSIKKGEYDSIDEIFSEEELSHYASWKQKRSLQSSEVVESLLKGPHTSGCQIALGSLVTTLLYLSYDHKAVFNQAYQDITLNNAFFRKSALLPAVKYDSSGVSRARQGPNALKGEAGYLEALNKNAIDDPDYEGENLMFVETTKEATQDLIALGGFGNDRSERARPVERATGATKEMVRFWKAMRALQKAKRLSVANLVATIQERNAAVFKGAKEYAEIIEILERPFFSQTEVWGHPAGRMPLGDWLLVLYTYNPRTPYTLFIYDYGLDSTQWKNYQRAYLGEK